jgi:hypothetical protein
MMAIDLLFGALKQIEYELDHECWAMCEQRLLRHNILQIILAMQLKHFNTE